MSLVLVLMCACLPAYAQPPASATVSGTITDPSGAAIVGAQVIAKNRATNLLLVDTTNRVGSYSLSSLAPGNYELTVEAAGFDRSVLPQMRLSVGQSARMNFRLQVGTVKQSITVSPRELTLGNQTTNSQVLYGEELNALPVVTRNFVELTLLTPKVLPASSTDSRGYMGDRYRENQFSFEGVHHQYNNETIDGANATVFITNTLKSFYSLESVQEFRVSNSLWTAEQGHAMGGIVNVVTRSGTNAWHGEAYEYFRNNELNEPDILAVPGFDVLRKNLFGGSLGGPVQKDKAYVFSNYEGQRQANTPQLPPVFVSNLPAINAALLRLGFPSDTDHVVQTADYDQFLVRTDVVPGKKNKLMLRYNVFNSNSLNDRIGSHGQIDDPITPLASRDQHLRDQGVTANLLSFLAPNWINNSGFGWEKHDYQFKPHQGVPPIDLEVIGAFETGADYTELATAERKFHAYDSVTWNRGQHEIKFGAEYIRSDASQTDGPFTLAIVGGLQGLLAPQPLVQRMTHVTGALPTGYIFHANQAGTFLQDEWKVSSQLSLTLGLRYDLEMLSGLGAISDSGRGNVQPRIGFAWSPGNRPIVVRGGFGIYTADRYHPIMAIDALFHGSDFPNFNAAFLNANPFARNYHPLPNVDQTQVFAGPAALPAFLQFVRTGTVPANGSSLGFITVQSPNLPNPYAREWGLEIEYQLRPDFTIAAGYSGLQGLNFPMNINRDLLPATATLPNGKPDYQVVGPNAAAHLYDSRYAAVYISEPLGLSLYNAGTLTVRKRFGHNFSFNAHYVFSKAMDNFGALSVTTVPEDVYRVGRDWSVSNEHAKHRLVLWLASEAPATIPILGGFGSTILVTVQSPRYFNVTAGRDLNHDFDPYSDRPDTIGRNTFRGDNFATVDLRINRNLRINDRVNLNLIADFFNLFNRANINNFDTVYGQPTLSLPPVSTFATPRGVNNAFQTQLGVRLTF